MPYAPARACRYQRCPMLTRDPSGYCEAHRHKARAFHQESAVHRSPGGYGNWRRIREQVLRAHGIPESDWHLYDIDHDPVYDPAREPDHTKYKLTPMLHAGHSQKTVRHDHGFGRA
ncbi:MAG: hypothetical protein ABFC85_07440 [Rectinema sp.]